MIFITVGAQMPFDRLIRAVDQWAQLRERADVFAQIGLTDYRPQFLQYTAFMDPPEFRKKMEAADVIIAHAGTGTILTALELGKPILVMPRRGDLRETRNDHQIATAKRFLAQGRIFVAFDEEHLLEKLDYLDKLRPPERITAYATPALLSALRDFIEGKEVEFPALPLPIEEPLTLAKSPPIEWRIRLAEGIPLDGSRLGHREPVGQIYPAAHIKSRLKAMILLAGRLRPTDLSRRAGRSRLDLPIDEDRSILAFWRDAAGELASAWELGNLPVRVLLDQGSPMPTLPQVLATSGPKGRVTISLERDKVEFRGTGGLLHDVCADYDDEDWVLVANAAQLLYGSLPDMVDRLTGAQANGGGDVNVVHDRDGIPNGLILLRCGVLRSVSDVGFHDMKEQVIPNLARLHRVRVLPTQGYTSRPIHTLKDFTETLRTYYARHNGNGHNGSSKTKQPLVDLPHSDRWRSKFSIREAGAIVDPLAVVHDTVVLQGGVVEKGAVVVRSVVSQGARVRAGQRVFDEIVM